jgi:hypothetical protein
MIFSNHPVYQRSNWVLRILLTVFILNWPMMKLISGTFQDDEKARVRMELNYFKFKEDSSYLMVKVQTRVERQYQPVSGVIINLFLNEQTRSGMMGNITTDQQGEGTFTLPPKFYQAKDTASILNFMARLKNDPNYQDRVTSLEIRDARVKVIPIDSSKQIMVRLTQKDSTSNHVPVEGAAVKCYVQRMFSRLPVGDEFNFTDEDGQVLIQLPKDLPGDESGNIKLIVGLEEDDNFGNIFASPTLPWGSSLLKHEDLFDERTMWASREKTPPYMLIWPNLILLIVWGVIVYLIVQLKNIYRDTEVIKTK